MPGTLVVCSTPIGNLGDASPRLRQALASADIVYCEDTRRSRKLTSALGVSVPLRSYFVGNERARSVELADRLVRGETVALITDAGTPAVSDPGLSAVRAAAEVGATITVVPGPSAVTAAIAVSGLPSERWVFEGFLPRKAADRSRRLAQLAGETRTMVFFMTPARAPAELAELAGVCEPDRPVVIGRELTKRNEEIWRGTLSGALTHLREQPPRGELTVVLGGSPTPPGDVDAAVDQVVAAVGQGERFSEAVRRAADTHGVRRRLVYEAARRYLGSS